MQPPYRYGNRICISLRTSATILSVSTLVLRLLLNNLAFLRYISISSHALEHIDITFLHPRVALPLTSSSFPDLAPHPMHLIR